MKRAAIAHLVGSTFYIWATRWHLGSGCMCVHSGGSCLLAGAACTPTSAATSTPASPSICINLRLFHLRLCFSSRLSKVHNCGRSVCTCLPGVPLFTSLHLCTQDTPRISPHRLTHLTYHRNVCKNTQTPCIRYGWRVSEETRRKNKSKENITNWKYKKSKFGQNYSCIQMSTVQRQQIVWIVNKIYVEKTGR